MGNQPIKTPPSPPDWLTLTERLVTEGTTYLSRLPAGCLRPYLLAGAWRQPNLHWRQPADLHRVALSLPYAISARTEVVEIVDRAQTVVWTIAEPSGEVNVLCLAHDLVMISNGSRLHLRGPGVAQTWDLEAPVRALNWVPGTPTTWPAIVAVVGDGLSPAVGIRLEPSGRLRTGWPLMVDVREVVVTRTGVLVVIGSALVTFYRPDGTLLATRPIRPHWGPFELVGLAVIPGPTTCQVQAAFLDAEDRIGVVCQIRNSVVTEGRILLFNNEGKYLTTVSC